jgi:hypothetical protein
MLYKDNRHRVRSQTLTPRGLPTTGVSNIPTMSLSEADQRPKVGIGAFILNANDEFLMGRRKGSNGAGESLDSTRFDLRTQ